MPSIHAFTLHAACSLKNEDQSTTRLSALYLGPVKVATVLETLGVRDCEDALQLLLCHPFCEERLRAQLSALNPEREDYGPEALVRELLWMDKLEKEYLRHADKPNGGMLALQLEGGEVTLGIPKKLAAADEETLLASCAPMFPRYEALYGPVQGYLIFRSIKDFDRGAPLDPQSIKGK